MFIWGRLYLLLAALCHGVSSNIQLQKMYGRITSPDFPNVYPNNKERTWNISVPKGYTIRIYFTHFNMELSYLCEYDYVKVCRGSGAMTVSVGVRENFVSVHVDVWLYVRRMRYLFVPILWDCMCMSIETCIYLGSLLYTVCVYWSCISRSTLRLTCTLIYSAASSVKRLEL